MTSDEGLTPGWSYSLKCLYDTVPTCKDLALTQMCLKTEDTKPNLMYYYYEYGDLNHLQGPGD